MLRPTSGHGVQYCCGVISLASRDQSTTAAGRGAFRHFGLYEGSSGQEKISNVGSELARALKTPLGGSLLI
jgi:hypothetical protein